MFIYVYAHSQFVPQSIENIGLSIIMPVFNEEDIIYRSLDNTISVMDNSGVKYEIIAVDDGSSDRSVGEMMKLSDRIIVTGYNRNRGKGYALRYGTKLARGEVIAFFDSDLNIEPSHLPLYYNSLVIGNSQIAIGSKRIKGASVKTPLARKTLSVLYHIFTKVLLDLKVKDSQVGLKLFKREVVEKVMPILTIERYALDVELLALSSRLGYRILEIPVRISMKAQASKINIRAIEKMFVDTFRIFYKLRVTKDPELVYPVSSLTPYSYAETEKITR